MAIIISIKITLKTNLKDIQIKKEELSGEILAKVNIVKLEFEVNCCAEKILIGLQNLQKFTNKIQSQDIIECSQNKELYISHILFSKQMQIQRDIVVANYYNDVGLNINNCYVSVSHHKVPEILGVTRTYILKGGHTFFEQYETEEERLSSSCLLAKKQIHHIFRSSKLNDESTTYLNNNNINNPAFRSMNLNIGQIKTKVRFYGEFFCKSQVDESLTRMIFLTEFKEYIQIIKNISNKQSATSSLEYERESFDQENQFFQNNNNNDPQNKYQN